MDEVIDLFAGPGGLDVAVRSLGLDPLGIEFDDSACATREAAGLRTRQADVAALDPTDFAPCEGIIGSPPCPTFSRGGNGAGRQLAEIIFSALEDLAEGRDTRAQRVEEAFRVLEPTADFDELPEPRALRKRLQRRSSPVQAARLAARRKLKERRHKEAVMSLLVAEPLRWTLALEPRFMLWEQVPDVLPFWERCAEYLRAAGWNVWTGVLEAERYGVPQTRERAILMASSEKPVGPPQPTHQRYVKGEPRRHELTLEGEIMPWVSMAEALGWPVDRPSPTVTGGGTDAGGPEVFGRGGREAIRLAAENWPAEKPSPTIVGGSARCEGGVLVYGEWRQARDSGPGAEREPRDSGEPSYTIRANGSGSHPSGVRWVPDELPKLRSGNTVNGGERAERDAEEPSVTITTRADNCSWVHDRPATTVQGDPRLFPAGRAERNPDYKPGDEAVSQAGSGGTAVRVTLEEAAMLQTFPPNYPFQGTKSKQFEQVGNAVPPLLARAILEALPIHDLAEACG